MASSRSKQRRRSAPRAAPRAWRYSASASFSLSARYSSSARRSASAGPVACPCAGAGPGRAPSQKAPRATTTRARHRPPVHAHAFMSVNPQFARGVGRPAPLPLDPELLHRLREGPFGPQPDAPPLGPQAAFAVRREEQEWADALALVRVPGLRRRLNPDPVQPLGLLGLGPR